MADNNSPWGRKPTGSSGNRGGTGSGGGGNSTPPSGNRDNNPFEKLLRDAQSKVRGGMSGYSGGNERRFISIILLVILGLWLGSGIYRVNSDELGVVLRFGQYNRTSTPGLNYHLPYPIEDVLIPSVTTVNRVEIGFRSNATENPGIRVARLRGGDDGAASSANRDGLMLTADRNIVDIDFEVQWKVDAAHPEKFLFNTRDPAGNVRQVAESAMREVIGRTNLDGVLTTAQRQIPDDTKQLMQKILDSYDAGIEIIAVNLSRPDVPAPVIDEFQDVKRAEQDKQTAESVAEGYRNEIIPRAKGDAAKMREDAQAYKSRVVADAQGDAARFNQVYAQYAVAKDVTKRRIYLETMEDVLRGMPKIVVDNNGKSGVTSVLPLIMPGPRNAAAPVSSTPSVSAAPAVPLTK